MSVKKYSIAIAITGFMLFMVIASANNVRAQSNVLDSIWVTPSTINFNQHNATVGTLFNLTVWAYVENDSYTWQTNMTFDPTVFQEVATGLTAGVTSNYFAGLGATVAPPPVINNNSTTPPGFVLSGESLLTSPYAPQNNASLTWIEFNITKMPTPTNPTPITGVFDINGSSIAGPGTFFDDPNLNSLVNASNIFDASYTLSYLPPPTIGVPTQVPGTTNVNDSVPVIVSANVTDNSGTGINYSQIVYSTDGWTTNNTVTMTLNSTTGLYDGTIPGEVGGTVVDYVVQAYDNSGGFSTSTPYSTYQVVPEFTVLALLLVMIATLGLTALIARKKRGK